MSIKTPIRLNAQSLNDLNKQYNDQFDKIDKSLQTLMNVVNTIDNRIMILENSFKMVKDMIARRGWLYMSKDNEGNSILKDVMTRSDKEKDIPIYGVDGNIREKHH